MLTQTLCGNPKSFLSVSTGSSSEDEEDSDTLAPMITWKDFQKLMPWEIVILVGGGYALAAGCKVRTGKLLPLPTRGRTF